MVLLFVFGRTSGQWEEVLIDLWAHLTPVCLVMAATVLMLRMMLTGRWRKRMTRASAFLILSYAVLMVRVLLGRYNPHDGDNAPLPIFAIFYLLAAIYFLYALTLEWLIPFLWWGICKLRGRTNEKACELTERLDDGA